MTPQGHFVSLTRKLKQYARYQDAKGIGVYLQSQEFWGHLVALRDDHERRQKVLRAISDASGRCRAALDAKAPIRAPGKRRVSWTEPTIARFRKALRRGGVEGGARELGISLDAARRAARRYAEAAPLKLAA